MLQLDVDEGTGRAGVGRDEMRMRGGRGQVKPRPGQQLGGPSRPTRRPAGDFPQLVAATGNSSRSSSSSAAAAAAVLARVYLLHSVVKGKTKEQSKCSVAS